MSSLSLDVISEVKKLKTKKRKGPVDKEKTISKLKKATKINKHNVKIDLDNVLNKRTTKGVDGKMYGTDHWKRALNYDLAWGAQAKKKINESKKINSLKTAKEKATSKKLPTTYKKTSIKK